MATKRLGVPPWLYCAPLIGRLRESQDYDIVVDLPGHIALKLREHELHAAFLSPIEYARDSSEYVIVPGVAVCSSRGNNSINLHFREHLREIRTLAVNPSSVSEIILAKIILAEEFDLAPAIVPVAGTLHDMLLKADGALLVGDESLREAGFHQGALDLVDFWNDVTALPYVHGFWCGREGDLRREDVVAFRAAKEEGSARIADMDETVLLEDDIAGAMGFKREYLSSFFTDFTNEALDGLREFLRYAYYHGVLPDVAELNFLHLPEDNEPDDLPISTN